MPSAALEPEEYRASCFSFDIHKYSERIPKDQAEFQKTFRWLVTESLKEIKQEFVDGIPSSPPWGDDHGRTWYFQEAGDGGLCVAPPNISAEDIRRFLDVFKDRQHEYNRRLGHDSKIKVRVGIDRGPISRAHTGVAGEPPIVAARLRDCHQARELLEKPRHIDLTLVISQEVHRDFTKHGLRDFDRDSFKRIKVKEKTYESDAYLYVPNGATAATPPDAIEVPPSSPSADRRRHRIEGWNVVGVVALVIGIGIGIGFFAHWKAVSTSAADSSNNKTSAATAPGFSTPTSSRITAPRAIAKPTNRSSPARTTAVTQTKPAKSPLPAPTAAPAYQLVTETSFRSGSDVIIQATSGLYVRAEFGFPEGDRGMLRAITSGVSKWETFTLTWQADHRAWSLRSSRGTYVTAEVDRTDSRLDELRAQAAEVASWELFRLYRFSDGRYAIKSVESGKFVTVVDGPGDLNKMLQASASQAGAKEKFQLIVQD